MRDFKGSFLTGFSSFREFGRQTGVGVCLGDGYLNITGAVPFHLILKQVQSPSELQR